MKGCTMETRDLISFTPKAFMVIDQKKQFDLLYHPKHEKKYSPVLRVLREGPLTLKELEYKYNAVVDEPKKKNTIYSYVQDLEKVGLVTKCGQRITPGHTFCEWLYNRSAVLFYPVIFSEDTFKTKRFANAIENMQKVISLYSDKTPTVNKLRETLFSIYRDSQKKVGDIFTAYSDEIAEIMGDVQFRQLDRICTILEMVMALSKFSEQSKIMLDELGIGETS